MKRSIKPGIVGIRSYLRENKTGWHVFMDGDYVKFVSRSLTDLIEWHTGVGMTLVGICGNTIHFQDTSTLQK